MKDQGVGSRRRLERSSRSTTRAGSGQRHRASVVYRIVHFTTHDRGEVAAGRGTAMSSACRCGDAHAPTRRSSDRPRCWRIAGASDFLVPHPVHGAPARRDPGDEDRPTPIDPDPVPRPLHPAHTADPVAPPPAATPPRRPAHRGSPPPAAGDSPRPPVLAHAGGRVAATQTQAERHQARRSSSAIDPARLPREQQENYRRS